MSSSTFINSAATQSPPFFMLRTGISSLSIRVTSLNLRFPRHCSTHGRWRSKSSITYSSLLRRWDWLCGAVVDTTDAPLRLQCSLEWPQLQQSKWRCYFTPGQIRVGCTTALTQEHLICSLERPSALRLPPGGSARNDWGRGLIDWRGRRSSHSQRSGSGRGQRPWSLGTLCIGADFYCALFSPQS